MAQNFGHRLDLAVRLVNAVDGSIIGEKQAIFSHGEVTFRPRLSVNGDWLFIDTGREDFVLGVNARGFEKARFLVEYKTLNCNQPAVEIPLVPKQSLWNVPPLETLEGKIEGMQELQAVAKREADLYAVSYEEKDCQLTLYNPYRKKLIQSYYALTDRDWQEFEIIRIRRKLPGNRVQASHALKRKWEGRYALAHPVYGLVSEDGGYLLRLPKYEEDLAWRVRFVVNGREYFQDVDIHHPVIFML